MPYFVYIAQCADETLYIGIARDVKRRIEEHNTSKLGARYTRVRRPVVLRYAEQCASRSDALKREWQLKQLSRREKLALVRGA